MKRKKFTSLKNNEKFETQIIKKRRKYKNNAKIIHLSKDSTELICGFIGWDIFKFLCSCSKFYDISSSFTHIYNIDTLVFILSESNKSLSYVKKLLRKNYKNENYAHLFYNYFIASPAHLISNRIKLNEDDKYKLFVIFKRIYHLNPKYLYFPQFIHRIFKLHNNLMINFLLKINIENNYYLNIFEAAAGNNRLDVIKTLIKWGKITNYNLINSDALINAVEDDNIEISKYLINLGCDVNHSDMETTAFIEAALNRNIEMMCMLIRQKEFIIDDTVFYSVCDDKLIKILKIILSSPDYTPNNYGLILASSNGQINTLRLLLRDKRLDINFGYEINEGYLMHHNSPLIAACCYNKKEVVKLLLLQNNIKVSKNMEEYLNKLNNNSSNLVLNYLKKKKGFQI